MISAMPARIRALSSAIRIRMKPNFRRAGRLGPGVIASLGGSLRAQRKRNGNRGSCAVRFDFHIATELPHPLAHSPNTDAGTLTLDFCEAFGPHPFSLVRDLNFYFALIAN